MADGTSRPIEEVKAGDRVLARDEVTGATGAQTVEEVFARVAAASLVLHLDSGETVETTDEHPFYVAATGFVPAGRLAVGNAVVTRAGPPAVVVAIERRRRPLVVHNLRVEGAHTYFVGLSGGGVWVHNAPCPPASGGPITPAISAHARKTMQRRGWASDQYVHNFINDPNTSARPFQHPRQGPATIYEQPGNAQVVIDNATGEVVHLSPINPPQGSWQWY